jgi:hypothetical protein
MTHVTKAVLNIFRLTAMKRAGILNALDRRYYPQRINDALTEEPPSMTLKRVQTFFALLGTGFLLACFLLLLEITVHRMAQKKRNFSTKD